jgi:hypothetical protein
MTSSLATGGSGFDEDLGQPAAGEGGDDDGLDRTTGADRRQAVVDGQFEDGLRHHRGLLSAEAAAAIAARARRAAARCRRRGFGGEGHVLDAQLRQRLGRAGVEPQPSEERGNEKDEGQRCLFPDRHPVLRFEMRGGRARDRRTPRRVQGSTSVGACART